jgi:hypothetical protein
MNGISGKRFDRSTLTLRVLEWFRVLSSTQSPEQNWETGGTSPIIIFWIPDRLSGLALEVFYGTSERPEIKYSSTKLPIHAVTYRKEIL